MSNKYLDHLEKKAILDFLGGAALTHVVQNGIVKKMISTPTTGKYIGHAFNEGVRGVVDKSLAGKAKRVFTGAIAPDINLMHSKMHELGEKMAPHLKDLDLKQRAVLHHVVSKGSLPNKYKHYANDIKVHAAYGIARSHAKNTIGVELPHLKDLVENKELSNLWKSKDHPLLSNIAKNVGSGKSVGKKYGEGHLTSGPSFLGSAMIGVKDPAAGAVDGLKAAMSSKAFNNNKYGKKVTHKLEQLFVKNPIMKGHANPDKVGGKAINFVKDIAISPVAGNLKRTSAAMTKAVTKAE
jgi:hypothetical protein